jgi:hypothetical protein
MALRIRKITPGRLVGGRFVALNKNPAPPGYNRKWYQKGFRARMSARSDDDSYSAWHRQTGKPGDSESSGKRIEAKESFLLGFHEARSRRPNESLRKTLKRYKKRYAGTIRGDATIRLLKGLRKSRKRKNSARKRRSR